MSGQSILDQDRRPNFTSGPQQTQSIDENCLVEESSFNHVAIELHTLNLLSRFGHGVGIVLRHVEDTVDRLAWEAKYIRDFQPPLNTPWVGQLLGKLRLHERRFTLPSPGTGRRFVDRARRHARYKFSASLQPVESNAVFLSLYKLGSNSKQKFHEAKLLRSRLTDLTHLYLRARLMKFISEPWKTRATDQLRLTLAFRQGHPPPANRLLILAPLSHDLRQEVQILLRRLICQERCNFPPLHLPTTKLVYCKGQQLATQVFNYRALTLDSHTNNSLHLWQVSGSVSTSSYSQWTCIFCS